MLLEISDLRLRYDVVEVVRGVNLQVEAGTIVTLIGANGAGKSTILKAISGLLKPLAGKIVYKDRRIDGLRPTDIVRSGIAQVPEGGRVFAKLTVAENLAAGAYLRRDKKAVARDLARVYGHFPRLKERQKLKAGSLSGGERQMLAFGRALMNGPELLLLDEPSLGLSPLMVEEIFKIARRIRDEGLTVLLVEQNAKKGLELADRAYVLETGLVTLEGPGKELLNSDEVVKSYLGG
jgi:branched-chain amino acid transport system ATP-binding protein